METRSKVSGWSVPLEKATGVAIWQSGSQTFSNFSACKVHGNQHEIRIASFECYYYLFAGNLELFSINFRLS